MNPVEPRYHQLGQLDSRTVYWDRIGKIYCIERDFEILCEMREEEIRRFYDKDVDTWQ